MKNDSKKYFSFTDAAEKVLKENSNKKPMHYKNIIKRALNKKWIITEGLTPQTTLTAVIGSENRRKIARGEEPRFRVYGNGYYGLSVWSPKGPQKQIELANKEVKERLLKKIKLVLPENFEKIIGELLPNLGFDNVKVTNYRGDGGIDVSGELVVGDTVRTKIVVQVKRWNKNIQVNTVRELRGSLTPHQQGLIITTSDFSRGAINDANNPQKAPIDLMNGKKLVELMVEHNVGIIKKELSLISLDEKWNIKTESMKPKSINKKTINIFGVTKGKKHHAQLIDLKKVKLNHKIFNAPSSAAKSICGYPVNGWDFWKFISNGKTKTIDYLRKRK